MPAAVPVIDGKKPCSRCREVLPVEVFRYSLRKTTGKYTYSSACKPCENSAVQTRRDADREGYNAYHRARWAKVSEEEKSRKRSASSRWYASDKGKAYKRGWYWENLESQRVYQRVWSAEKRATGYKYEFPSGQRKCSDCDVLKEETQFPSRSSSVCKLCNRARVREWRTENPERSRSAAKSWRDRNPDQMRVQRRRRRSRKAGAQGQHSADDIKRLVHRFHGLCAYCGVEPFNDIEHVVPLSRGGSDYIGNLLPACRTCNSKKHKKLLIEWKAEVYNR